MAEEKSISLETLQGQQANLSEAVTQLTTQRTQLEEQLTAVRNQLATNIGALQYANALIESLGGNTTDPADVAPEGTETEELTIEDLDTSQSPDEVTL